MSKRILVAVDGSQSSLRALEFAARSGQSGEHVKLLVLAVQPNITSRRLPRKVVAEYQADLAEEALAPARQIIDSLGADADCYARSGEAGSTIVALALRTRCSEVVMGTRGLSRIAGLFLGSVATKVVQLSPLPVTLVK